ncbi:hypothetical protein AGMMS49965_26060 [Bacteroidia bacterium]|nr:hypothetical protein AGMMS49965_26060 [Bacteroidia bacterium]
MKNLVEDGKTIKYTVAGADVKSGDPVVIGSLVGVAVTDGAVGDTIAVALEGVYSLPKDSAAITKGAKAYVKVTEGVAAVTATATGATLAGYAFEAAAAGDSFVFVKLSF